MIGQAWRDDFKRKQGEQVYLDALRDYALGTLGGTRHSLIAAQTLSVLILATPLVVGLLGAALTISTLPSWGGAFFGVILMATGYFLWPTRYRLPKDALTPDQAPVFFAQLDQISDALNAPKISHVVVTDDFNAFVMKEGRRTVLGIGALLWETATSEEKLALIGHEIAHLVNNDPARSRIIGYGLETLARWEHMVAPDGTDNVFAEVVLVPFHVLIAGLERALLRPLFLQSQRAEYLADALAAEVAGSTAVVSLLKTLSLGDNLQEDWNKLHGLADATGRGVLTRLVSSLSDMDPDRRTALLAQVEAKKLCVDATHPPNAYRIAFVETATPDGLRLPADLFETEDAAIVARLDAIGEQLAIYFDAQ